MWRSDQPGIGQSPQHPPEDRLVRFKIAEAAAIGRREGDAWTVSFAVFMQALAALERHDYEWATALALEAEQISVPAMNKSNPPAR